MLISIEGTGKYQLEPGLESMGDAPVLSHFSLPRNPGPKPTGVLENCREVETNCWFSIFGSFTFDRIPKATKNVNVHFFIHSSNTSILYERIPGSFISYYLQPEI